MTLNDKAELVRLLNLYQSELLKENEANNVAIKRRIQGEEADYSFGVKAQYDHARIISKKLAEEIGREIKTNWDFC